MFVFTLSYICYIFFQSTDDSFCMGTVLFSLHIFQLQTFGMPSLQIPLLVVKDEISL